MQETLLQQGLDITLFGMGIVFTFLLLLVIGTSIMSRIITRHFPEVEPASHSPSHKVGNDSARLHAVIKAAIEQHRQRR
ncbi:OadG family protein [Microbulbifer sp. OS29]|uniref:Probable oxaloacetate decarboxylase gamma chain n=1 Tax=Microbulbifer okhotskensis TaxID=2926617 RepID=A0A9X2J679_9GAMM|nr:OadG family protein [Microbulbifer okhotskensis]MCO1336357.1 OadG family protein [Microbulbifer okhotskensis]